MKPILFNADMVRAILDNRKTVTRRVVKPQPPATAHVAKIRYSWCWSWWEDSDSHKLKPPYCPGDILYVRETWNRMLGDWIYKADQKLGMKNPGKWRPSIHMPREAARIFLQVTDVKVDRLRDIKEWEAVDEGAVKRPQYTKRGDLVLHRSYIKEFSAIWDSTIKPADRARYGWDANPWVWVIEFERCERPKGGS